MPAEVPIHERRSPNFAESMAHRIRGVREAIQEGAAAGGAVNRRLSGSRRRDALTRVARAAAPVSGLLALPDWRAPPEGIGSLQEDGCPIRLVGGRRCRNARE